jgi:hypothetical protein
VLLQGERQEDVGGGRRAREVPRLHRMPEGDHLADRLGRLVAIEEVPHPLIERIVLDPRAASHPVPVHGVHLLDPELPVARRPR